MKCLLNLTKSSINHTHVLKYTHRPNHDITIIMWLHTLRASHIHVLERTERICLFTYLFIHLPIYLSLREKIKRG